MNRHAPPAPFPWGDLGGPALVLVRRAPRGPNRARILRASSDERRALTPWVSLLRAGPTFPAGDRITIAIARPVLLARFLEGDITLRNLETIVHLVGLELRPEPERQAPLAPLLTWCAQLGGALRARLHGARRAHARRPFTTP